MADLLLLCGEVIDLTETWTWRLWKDMTQYAWEVVFGKNAGKEKYGNRRGNEMRWSKYCKDITVMSILSATMSAGKSTFNKQTSRKINLLEFLCYVLLQASQHAYHSWRMPLQPRMVI